MNTHRLCLLRNTLMLRRSFAEEIQPQKCLWTFIDLTFMFLTTIKDHKCLLEEVISNFAEA